MILPVLLLLKISDTFLLLFTECQLTGIVHLYLWGKNYIFLTHCNATHRHRYASSLSRHKHPHYLSLTLKVLEAWWHPLWGQGGNVFVSVWHLSLRQRGPAQDNPSVLSMYPLPLQLAVRSPAYRRNCSHTKHQRIISIQLSKILHILTLYLGGVKMTEITWKWLRLNIHQQEIPRSWQFWHSWSSSLSNISGERKREVKTRLSPLSRWDIWKC